MNELLNQLKSAQAAINDAIRQIEMVAYAIDAQSVITEFVTRWEAQGPPRARSRDLLPIARQIPALEAFLKGSDDRATGELTRWLRQNPHSRIQKTFCSNVPYWRLLP